MAKYLKVSPFAPKEQPYIPEILGVKFASTNCGLYKHKNDLTLVHFPHGASVAGVFTMSKMASPPVLKSKHNLKKKLASALIVNSGNSFAMTGKKGEKSVEKILLSVANCLDVDVNEVFISSTGVIGCLPDHDKIINALPQLVQALDPKNMMESANTIMTTDTFPKVCSAQTEISGKAVTIAGIAKGSGMIEPNMATMLAYIFTDASIPSTVLQEMTSRYVETSFNSITVDSDTSTSDSLMVFATNMVKHEKVISIHDEHVQNFANALQGVMQNLAKQIIQDGEGISKCIAVNVCGAKNDKSAKVVAKAIANSPLVKTAIAGSDPNWGRIAMAVGKTSEAVDLTQFSVKIGDCVIYDNESINPDYNEESVYKYLQRSEIEITVNLGVGNGQSTVWTCDLTHGYIDINTDYRS